MDVIESVRIPADDFEFGRILSVGAAAETELDPTVPLGSGALPLVWVVDAEPGFADAVREHRSVAGFRPLVDHDERTLYVLDSRTDDSLLAAIEAHDGSVYEAVCDGAQWRVVVGFPSHESIAGFESQCEEAGIDVDRQQVYNATEPDAGPWFGVTASQREALQLAVEKGYYSLPRGVSTKELATELGISDQAVTERLRRGIETLVDNSLLATAEDDGS